jgi:hypothetical protein
MSKAEINIRFILSLLAIGGIMFLDFHHFPILVNFVVSFALGAFIGHNIAMLFMGGKKK